jgi:hypothetical protein
LPFREEKNVVNIINSLPETTLKNIKRELLYKITTIDSKNQGCVATYKIKAGARIRSGAPLFTLPLTPLQNTESVIIKRLKSLDKDQQRAFLSLHNAHGGKYSDFLGIVKTNMMPLGADSPTGGIFLEASRINHTCNPNAQNMWNENLNKITIHSIKDIEEGEEITVSYLAVSANYQNRQKKLKGSFSIDCTCKHLLITNCLTL